MEKWQNQMLLKLVQLVLPQKILPHLYLRWRATFSCELQKWWSQVPSDPGLSESGMSGGRSESRKGLIHVLHVLKAPEFQLWVRLLQGLKCSDGCRSDHAEATVSVYSTSCCWKTSVYFPNPRLLNSSGRSEPFREEFRLQPLLPFSEEMQSM